jgi:hypothetical protein
MRRFTLITLIVLFVLLVGAALYQLTLANRDAGPFRGPVKGTPLPTGLGTT